MSNAEQELHGQAGTAHVADLAGRRAYEQAWRQFSQGRTAEEYCRSWLVIQCRAIGGVAEGVVVMLRPGTTALAPVAFFPENPRDRAHLARISERALQEGRGVVEPLAAAAGPGEKEPRFQIAYPVRLDGTVHAVASFEIRWRAEPELQSAMRELQWGSGWLEVLLRRHADPKDAEPSRLRLALELVASLLEQPRLADSATALVTELGARLACDRVSLGVLEGGAVRIRAVSHSPQFEKRANLMRAIEAAMEESVDQGASVAFPPTRADAAVVARAHEALLQESGAGGAATFPLQHAGRVTGALTLERAAGQRFDLPTLELCEAVAAVAGPIVELKRVGEASLAAHAGRSAQALWRRLAGPGHAGFKLGLAAFAAAATFLALATGSYRISANATLEGAVQRAVTAPINGYVKEAALRAGDRVSKGQLIGRFEDRELRLERAKLASQREQLGRQYREAMAKRERAQAEIVTSQLAQSEAQMALLEEQLARTAMLAPFDGVIVSGDLSQSLGAPVERGQVLFEIAPLGDYRVALQVDERDVAHVLEGQRGELTVSSIPGERHGFTVTRVTPVNSARDGRNFFRVEATLDAPPAARLRPGMEGVGKIHVEERRLVWIWTHALTDWVRLWVWSWLP